ncbi:MAG: radical SAM protein [Gemmatimonadales bacterium]|nr:radical SAM protein [Gemmatimonadales bacterium]
MRVLLIYPNAKKEIIAWGDMGAIAEPIALEYIGAGAGLDGHEVKLLDLRLHIEDLEHTLRELKPDVVGVTGYSMHVLRNLEVCKIVKQLVPDCRTVVGGHHATLEPVDFMEPQIDYVVIGEGVGPFRQILALLERDEPVQNVAGVWARVNGGFVYGGDTRPFDINTIPPPDRTLALNDRDSYFIDWMKPIALMRTTVGCPYRCTFCSLWRIMEGRYYKRDIEAVVDELKSIPERYVFLVDDEPFVDPRRMKALADAIEQADVDKEYFAYCRIDTLLKDLELMKQWKRLGLRRLLFGIETVFDHELEDYNKRYHRQQIVQGLKAARDIGISVFCNFIINPNYTEKHFTELVNFIRQNEVDYPSFTILTPIPGTGTTYDEILDLQPNGRPNWDYFDLQHAVTPTTLQKERFMELYNSLYHIFSLSYLKCESPLTVQGFKERSAELSETYIQLATRVLGQRSTAPTADQTTLNRPSKPRE